MQNRSRDRRSSHLARAPIRLREANMSNVKVEDDEDLTLGDMYPWKVGDNVASSSSSRVRSSFIEMGFPPSLVDKAIEENGEDNEGMLLETLCEYSATKDKRPESSNSLGGLLNVNNELARVLLPKEKVPHSSSAESSDSLDSLFGEKNDASSHVNISMHGHPKEEPDISSGVKDEKKATLLMMNFSEDEVDYAINKLGEDALISDIIDFISAAQIAESSEKNVRIANCCDDEKNVDASTESLFGTLNNTLRLLEMGFSEKDISAAIDMCGSKATVAELADSIVSGQIGKYTFNSSLKKHVDASRSFSGLNGQGSIRYDDLTIKTEDYCPVSDSKVKVSENVITENYIGKRPNAGYIDESTSSKRPKEEYDDDLSSVVPPPWLEARQGTSKTTSSRLAPKPRKARQTNESPMLPKAISCRSLDRMAAGPPYFFYGNVLNLSQDSWIKISQFLYAVEPEFVNTQFFSALSRKEGYVHNFPNENRFHISSRSPMTIEDVIPRAKKWWPAWDTRKQISCINTDLTGISQQCNRLERLLTDYGGLLSLDQQTDLLHRCKIFNLVWVGHNKLKPVEPEHIERILGYPVGHTQAAGFSLQDRLEALKHCFQIDTLAYHFSVLKSLFPDGLTLLSIYSGVGGAEITLDRLGIRLKGVVAVETSETKRKILKQWWSNSGQSGELVQIEDIQKLSSSKLELLKQKLGVFDLVICQTPSTYNPKHPTIEDIDGISGLDFSLFYEFVRILQRVKSMAGK
ncbi:putative inactive DNA (Cytosine-5)-methyltransferase DRM3 [Heracleum sosnowskyi]|uniref:Inactive DNA (Cytosine-5)-methyltransferase DRM3 n=1 Tax=Heracleum sosnowskyi TaxID=360622 RepID=A0AAD8IHZ2_9APIA|nr:putative inactive DNA (Cytosine-5)-methyltransferase DRM3 [Heracleum sosnowskyi]